MRDFLGRITLKWIFTKLSQHIPNADMKLAQHLPSTITPGPSDNNTQIELQRRYKWIFVAEAHVGPPEFFEEELELLQPLVKTKFATDYRGICRLEQVVIKVYNKERVRDAEREKFRVMIKKMATVFHPNLALFLGSCTTARKLMIISENLPNNLVSVLQAKNQISLSRRLYMAKEIALALNWLHHTPQIHHYRLSPFNILVDDNLQIKLSDYGQSSIEKLFKYNILNDTEQFERTIKWMAPEILEGKTPTEKSDTYSFGLEYSKLDEFINFSKNNTAPLEINGNLSNNKNCFLALESLLHNCTQKDPSKRPPSFDAILVKINNAILHACVPDDFQSAGFWKKYFGDKTSVKWSTFLNCFAHELKLCPEITFEDSSGNEFNEKNIHKPKFTSVTNNNNNNNKNNPSNTSSPNLTFSKLISLQYSQLQAKVNNKSNKKSSSNSEPINSSEDTNNNSSSSINLSNHLVKAIKCFEYLASDKGMQFSDAQVIKLETFGQVVGWFGSIYNQDNSTICLTTSQSTLPNPTNQTLTPSSSPGKKSNRASKLLPNARFQSTGSQFLDTIYSVCSTPGFYGKIPASSCKNLLSTKTIGTYLIRLSATQSSSYALSLTLPSKEIQHYRLQFDTSSRTWKTNDGREHSNLNSLINDAYRSEKNSLCQIPCLGSKFHGIINIEDGIDGCYVEGKTIN